MTAVSQNDSGNETQSTKIHKTLQRQVSSSETVENVSLNPSDVQRLEFQSEDSQKQETSQDNSAFKVFDNPQTDQDVHPVPTLQITDGVPTLTTENEANVDTNVMLSSCELLIRPRHRRPKPGRLAKASRIYRAELQAYLDKQQQKEEEKQQQQQRWQRYGGYRFTKSRLSQPGEKSGEAKPKKASLHEVKMLHENKSGGLEIPTVKQQTSSLSSDSKRLQDDSTFLSKRYNKCLQQLTSDTSLPLPTKRKADLLAGSTTNTRPQSSNHDNSAFQSEIQSMHSYQTLETVDSVNIASPAKGKSYLQLNTQSFDHGNSTFQSENQSNIQSMHGYNTPEPVHSVNNASPTKSKSYLQLNIPQKPKRSRLAEASRVYRAELEAYLLEQQTRESDVNKAATHA
ncbi:uncharacterized protein LOC118425265 [Branchiostoma floridae]|uniref:Uncharacterized protein LOC118425265 n=1 Tax=Branchiostoma floridae TaxID=7739 RepID=A0A9J7LYR4_BRAFL|nr:uncharacterized protein LOC118425265 [Branchiostoma floridae]